MKKCGKEDCQDHVCELCRNDDVGYDQEPCSLCSVIHPDCRVCQFQHQE